MAQSTFHFGFGMLCATVCTIKPVIQAWCSKRITGGRQSPNIIPGGRQRSLATTGFRQEATKWQSPAAAATNVPTLSSAIARWCLWSYAIGTLAVIPAIVRRMTGIEPTHPIWNLFVGYPIIDRLPLPSIIVGEVLMGSILGAQYCLILLAIYQFKSPSRPPSQSD